VPDLDSILNEIKNIGPCLPGSLDPYYSVCGKPGCRCVDKDNPRKHGPYFRLSFSFVKKNSTMFVRKQDVDAVKTMVANYKRLRALTLELGMAALDSVKRHGVAATLEQFRGSRSDSEGSQGSWKDKCRRRSRQIRAAEVKIRDLTKSRDKWRQECLKLRKIAKAAEKTHSDQGSRNDETRKKK